MIRKMEVIQMPRRCFFCGSKKRMTKHHILPVSLNGSDRKDNIKWICDTCHKKLHSLLTPVINYLIKKISFERR